MNRREFLALAGKRAIAAAAVLAVPEIVLGNEISDITTIVNDSNFDKEVYKHKGKSIVLFYSEFEPYSPKIFPVFKELVRGYGKMVKFCSYELDDSYNPKVNSNWKEKWAEIKKKYEIDILPLTNMYVDGVLDVRIRGPPGEETPDTKLKEIIVKWIVS